MDLILESTFSRPQRAQRLLGIARSLGTVFV